MHVLGHDLYMLLDSGAMFLFCKSHKQQHYILMWNCCNLHSSVVTYSLWKLACACYLLFIVVFIVMPEHHPL